MASATMPSTHHIEGTDDDFLSPFFFADAAEGASGEPFSSVKLSLAGAGPAV